MIVSVATRFMLACYGQLEYHSMTETQQKLWTSKVGRSLASPPNLQLCLLHMKPLGAHLQAAIWRNALEPDLPSLQPTSYAWKQDCSNSLMKTTVLEGTTSLAPVQLLKLIRYSCESDMPCTKTKTKNKI